MAPLGRRFLLILGGIFLSFATWLGLWLLSYFFQPLMGFNLIMEGAIYNILFKAKPKPVPHQKLIIIDVEDASQQLSRGKYARLIDSVAEAGARVIGVDLIFAESQDPVTDDSLVQVANKQSRKLVFAYRFGKDLVCAHESDLHPRSLTNNDQPVPQRWREWNAAESVELPFHSLIANNTVGLGHVTYYHDYDNTARRFSIIIKFREGFYSSLALEVAKRYSGSKVLVNEKDGRLFLHKEGEAPLAVPFDENGDMLINLIPLERFTNKYSLTNLPKPLGNNVKDAVVLIVNSKAMEEWTDATPLPGTYPEWGLHASLITQILQQSFIQDEFTNTLLSSEIMIFIGMLWLVGLEYRFRRFKRKPWLVLLGINMIYLIVAYLMLSVGLHLLVLMPALVFSATYLVIRVIFYRHDKAPPYLNFSLAVLERQGKNYPLKVLKSPVGEEETNAIFEHFLDDETIQKMLQRLKDLHASSEDLAAMGNTLFKALFPEAINSLLTRSLDIVNTKWEKLRMIKPKGEKLRLRLELCIDPPELHSLPWELIRSTRLRPPFLVLNKSLSMTRYLPREQPLTKPRFRSPLRILVLIAKPADLQPLPGVLTEKKYIEKSLFWLRLIRDVKLTICENVTRGILADELERDPPDILHYIGHSSFDSARNKAFLALEPEPAAHDKDSGSARHLIPPQESALPEKKHYEEFEAEELGNLLSDSPVKLVILNSCEGAVAAQTDAFVGIAQNLVGAGVPAVVAMQYPIYDQSALLFSKIFYSSFIKNYSIDEAVTSARLHISRRIGLSKQDWATPVLFMRTHDENIFKIE